MKTTTKNHRISVSRARRNFADCVERVSAHREVFVLLRGKKAVAELCPTTAGRPLGELPKVLDSLPRLTPTEAARFSRDLTNARKKHAKERLRDVWES